MPTPKIPLRDGSDYELPWQIRIELGEKFHDVDKHLEDMRLWSIAEYAKKNHGKCKTRRGALSFITKWLQRSASRRVSVPESIVRAEAVVITEEDRNRNKERIADLKRMLKRG